MNGISLAIAISVAHVSVAHVSVEPAHVSESVHTSEPAISEHESAPIEEPAPITSTHPFIYGAHSYASCDDVKDDYIHKRCKEEEDDSGKSDASYLTAGIVVVGIFFLFCLFCIFG